MRHIYHRDFNTKLDGKYARVVARLPQNSTVLEVGCHTGYLLDVLQSRGHKAMGLEIDDSAAAVAKARGLDVITADIEREEATNSIKSPVDAILLLDVLEHVKNPEWVLANLKKKLKGGGRVIITAPNVAYWAVRKDLLLGRWDYQETGLLDQTHLRFFTQKTWIELVQKCGLKVTHFGPADGMIPLEQYIKKIPLVSKYLPVLREWMMKTFPTLFCISFLVEAVSNETVDELAVRVG